MLRYVPLGYLGGLYRHVNGTATAVDPTGVLEHNYVVDAVLLTHNVEVSFTSAERFTGDFDAKLAALGGISDAKLKVTYRRTDDRTIVAKVAGERLWLAAFSVSEWHAVPHLRGASVGIRGPLRRLPVRDGVRRIVDARLDRVARVGVPEPDRAAFRRGAHRPRRLWAGADRDRRGAVGPPRGVANGADVGPAGGPARTVRGRVSLPNAGTVAARPPGAGYLVFGIVYMVVAIGVSSGAAWTLSKRKDELA